MTAASRITEMVRDFLKMEASGGILLVLATALALILANTALGSAYQAFLDLPVAIKIGSFEIAKPLLLWINDGLMAIFFFLIGLEMKREFRVGELADPRQIALSGIAAVGGVVLPAIIYLAINRNFPANAAGWAIPTATDIAFALAVLSLLGDRVPNTLKILLLAIAIFDDLGAIVIIAIFYTNDLSHQSLLLAILPIVGLAMLNWRGVTKLAPYVILGILLWVLVLKSGVHSTLAGVVTALAIPLIKRKPSARTLLEDIEHGLHRWVAFGILPLFAFANAGVSFDGINTDSFLEPVKLGISLGLFAGKQIGVFGFLLLAILLGIAAKPRDVSWLQLYGLSVLSGIGFTMSLFIGSLAFEHANFDAPIRLGVLTGSILSAAIGFGIIWYTCRRQPQK